MPKKIGLRARGAVAALVVALTGGGAAVAATAVGGQQLPDLSAASLADLHGNVSPALAATIDSIRAASSEGPQFRGFNNY
jgi:hypothetical protein